LESEADDERDTTVADDSMTLLETLRKATAGAEVDVLREGVCVLAEAIMEAEVTEITGVAKGVRDPESA
jgi:transposase-like protein